MLASKFLQNTRTLLRRNALREPVRENHVSAIPARTKLSVAEKIIYGTMLTFSMWTIPAWVFYHIPDYQKEQRNEYTGK